MHNIKQVHAIFYSYANDYIVIYIYIYMYIYIYIYIYIDWQVKLYIISFCMVLQQKQFIFENLKLIGILQIKTNIFISSIHKF